MSLYWSRNFFVLQKIEEMACLRLCDIFTGSEVKYRPILTWPCIGCGSIVSRRLQTCSQCAIPSFGKWTRNWVETVVRFLLREGVLDSVQILTDLAISYSLAVLNASDGFPADARGFLRGFLGDRASSFLDSLAITSSAKDALQVFQKFSIAPLFGIINLLNVQEFEPSTLKKCLAEVVARNEKMFGDTSLSEKELSVHIAQLLPIRFTEGKLSDSLLGKSRVVDLRQPTVRVVEYIYIQASLPPPVAAMILCHELVHCATWLSRPFRSTGHSPLEEILCHVVMNSFGRHLTSELEMNPLSQAQIDHRIKCAELESEDISPGTLKRWTDLHTQWGWTRLLNAFFNATRFA